MLCFIKHQAPHNRRTISKTLIFLQLINCPASRLTLPLRLSTRGRETGSNHRERVPVCDREVLSHHIWDYWIPWGHAKYSPCLSFFLLFFFGGCRLGWEEVGACLIFNRMLLPWFFQAGWWIQACRPPPNACMQGSQEPHSCKHIFFIEVLPLQRCLAMHLNTERPLSDNSIVILLLVSLCKQDQAVPVSQSMWLPHTNVSPSNRNDLVPVSQQTMFRKVCAVGGFPNVIQVIRLKTHVYSGEFNKATRLWEKKNTRKQELSPDDFISPGSTVNQGQHLLGRGSSGDFFDNFKGNL